MKRIGLLTTLFAIAILAGPSVAAGCVPTRSDDVDLGTQAIAIPLTDQALGSTYYVVNDLCQLDELRCLFSAWIYHEANGVEGLQRGDVIFYDEDCGAGPDAIDW